MFIEIDKNLIIEIGQIQYGKCIIEKDNKSYKVRDGVEFFEFIVHHILDFKNLKRKSEYFHVYSENDEMPLSYKRQLASNLAHRLKKEFGYEEASKIKEQINVTLLRNNDSYSENIQKQLLHENKTNF